MRAILLLTLAACGFQSSAAAGIDGGVVADAAVSPDGPSITTCHGYTSLAAALDPSSYLVVTLPAQFKIAEQVCEAGRGHLVILDSDGESTIVAAKVTNGWVGFSDLKTEGTWIDVAGRSSPYMAAHWATNEPSMGGDDNCAFLNGTAGLNATNCGHSDGGGGDMRGYVCECDGIQGMTSNFNRPD